ncbi:hypothetical protein Pfo_031443 [Paulownia fortunei]|nr:hypothetical protein Pfo_031443 [Paulownia fortunei]
MTVAQLASLNNITNVNMIKVGQVLKVTQTTTQLSLQQARQLVLVLKVSQITTSANQSSTTTSKATITTSTSTTTTTATTTTPNTTNVATSTGGSILTTGLSATQAAWLNTAVADAKAATAGTGVLASVTVAQAILESGWGQSTLASAPYYNLFGIKQGTGWQGSIVNMNTSEYVNGKWVTVLAPFRSYSSQMASFQDHTNFLLTNSRYAANGVINAKNYVAMANGLQAAGSLSYYLGKGGYNMYQNYHTDETIQFSNHRFIEPFYENETVQADVYAAAKHITDVKSWISVWMALGQKANDAKQYTLSSAYYQLADFFVGEDDPIKAQTYSLFKSNYYQSIDKSQIEFDQYLINMGMSLKSGLPMTYQWELPVKAVLDYYNIEEADLMGMSLGGYLSMRAAAFEPRIKKVIAFDVYYSMMDSLTMKLPDKAVNAVHKINNPVIAALVNRKIMAATQNDVDMAF